MVINRRNFIRTSAFVAGGSLFGQLSIPDKSRKSIPGKLIRITEVDSNFEREPLIRPFGFKGGYMKEIWQTAALIKSESGIHKIGICSQSVLWSDAQLFSSHSESGGNALMYAMTEHGLSLLKNRSFTDPVLLLDEIWPVVYDYGKKICSRSDLRPTFALNSLVGIDNAIWLLYAAENNITNFDDLIPEPYKPALSHHHKKIASIPLMAYSIPVSEIKSSVDQGYFFLKIKIGQPGTQAEMLEKDIARLTEIHRAIGSATTNYSKSGKLPYYFDANGRYESKETLMRFLDHAKKIGAFDQIAIIEEPFDEHLEIDIKDIPVRIAADESAHTEKDALKRIEMGYKAIALKAIAKTLSMTMKIARVAYENNVPCFCADLTVNPILVEWNKNVAARLSPFPDIGIGLLETNGHQNYRNWEIMKGYNPCKDSTWSQTKKGVFDLNDDYYDKSGGIFMPCKHYEEIFASPLSAILDKTPGSNEPPNDQEAFKISIFSKHLQWLDFKEMANVLQEIGFDGADLTVRPGGHVLPDRVEEDLPKAAEALAKEGKKIYMLTTAIDTAEDPLTERILKTAYSLGIRHYRMGWGHYDDTRSVEENINSMQMKLKKIALLNEKYSISGEYQNHSGVASEGIYFGGAIWDIAKVLKEINSPWLGSQYDIYHATIEGANTWPVGFKLIRPYIRSIDIKDFKWIERDGKIRSEAVPLGEGMVDFRRYFRLLKENKLEIPISLHFEYPLGGAENGSSKLTIERTKVISAMKKDLLTLKKYLKDAGLV